MLTLAAMTGLDWGVIGVYCLTLLGTGIIFARRETKDTDDYFLAGRNMPAWAVAISIVATSMSAASFIGVPESSYNGDLTYLATNIGMVIAAIIIALVFIPAFYRRRVTTIYELLATRFGEPSRQAASWTFMIGRVMASGARIYIGAIPAAIVLFGPERGLDPGPLMVAIAVLTSVGILYTLIGGVSSVIWADVIQMAILVSACIVAIVLIATRIPASTPDVIAALQTGIEIPGTDETASKLRIFDLSTDLSRPFTLVAAIVGFTLMGLGSYGTDQDLAQRMLTCKSATRGSWSVVTGILVGIPSVALFLAVGLLLWIFYQQPGLMGDAAPATQPDDSRQVFLSFILDEMPPGLTGLMMAGLFAAGLSSLNSAINAMSSTLINDWYKRARPGRPDRHYLFAGRVAVVGWGLILGAFAIFSIFWQKAHQESGSGLLGFALGVMTFAYAGLIAVFLTALLTKRGNNTSVIAALITGFAVVLLLQPNSFAWWTSLTPLTEATPDIDTDLKLGDLKLAFVWPLTIGVIVSTAVCLLGKPKQRPATTD